MLFSKDLPKQLKIVSFLFRDCSNGCGFCFQKQYEHIPSFDEFTQIPSSVVAGRVLDVIGKYGCEYPDITVGFMGGELFEHPGIGQKLNDIVTEVVNAVPGVKIKVSTNLLYENTDQLLGFIESTRPSENVSVHTSYDFGPVRFNSADKFGLFKENFSAVSNIAGKYGIDLGIETVRTKHMLRSYLAEDKQFQFFKWLTENVNVCQNELIGDYEFALSASESEDLWRLCLLKTPSCSDLVSQFLDRGRMCMDTLRVTIIGDNTVSGCRYQKYGICSNCKTNDISECVKHYNCETCRFGNVCSLKCPVERYYDRCDKKGVFEWCRSNGIKIGGREV